MDETTYLGTVEDILGKTGSRGGVTQCRVQIQYGQGTRTITRNVKGAVKVGDKIILLEAEREARRMR